MVLILRFSSNYPCSINSTSVRFLIVVVIIGLLCLKSQDKFLTKGTILGQQNCVILLQ